MDNSALDPVDFEPLARKANLFSLGRGNKNSNTFNACVCDLFIKSYQQFTAARSVLLIASTSPVVLHCNGRTRVQEYTTISVSVLYVTGKEKSLGILHVW
jgi:hypothetical protein